MVSAFTLTLYFTSRALLEDSHNEWTEEPRLSGGMAAELLEHCCTGMLFPCASSTILDSRFLGHLTRAAFLDALRDQSSLFPRLSYPACIFSRPNFHTAHNDEK